MELSQPFFGTNRDIVTDNFFTSHLLAVDLLSNGLTLLGTLRKQRREVPAIMRARNPPHTSHFIYDHAAKITLTSYVPARNRVVILLSSSHGRGFVNANDPSQRPQMILDYNEGKGGVDQMDENLAEFTCIRKTVRWPLLIFYNIIDVASNNAFIHMKRSGYTKTKKEFLRALSLEMASPYAKNRHRVNHRLHNSIRHAAEQFDFRPFSAPRQNPVHQLGRCHRCSKVSRATCDGCQRFVCGAHKVVTKSCHCQDC